MEAPVSDSLPAHWSRFLRQAIRPRFMLPLFVTTCVIYAIVLYPWMMNWGATAAERQMALAGDEVVPHPAAQYTRAITIHAPVSVVWSWLVQLGQDRAGFYSYDWLENLTGAGIHNGNTLRADWQPRSVGDPVYMAPPELLGMQPGEGTILRVIGLDAGRSLLLAKRPEPYSNVWATVLLPAGANTTRLLVRERSTEAPSLLTKVFYQPAHFVMQSHFMRGIKARAEGQSSEPALLGIPAHLGWLVAGLTLFGLFLTLRRREPWWLLLPVAASVPALILAHDLNAGLAAFLSVGITIHGALRFGRRWWPPFLNLGAAVMLILLLAPNAYLVFGWVFLLLELGISGLWLVTQRDRAAGWIGHRLRPAA